MTRILLADDHAIVRKGLKETLEEISGLAVIAEVSTAEEALNLLATKTVELVVMDVSMPGRSGLDVLVEMKRRWPRLNVIIYTMHPEIELAMRAFKAGAAAYLTKDIPLSELVSAVKKIVNKGTYVPAVLGEQLARRLASGDAPSHAVLSERELQIMKFVAEGKSLKEIAGELALSSKTVSTYRARVLEKMQMHTNADLTRYVLQSPLKF